LVSQKTGEFGFLRIQLKITCGFKRFLVIKIVFITHTSLDPVLGVPHRAGLDPGEKETKVKPKPGGNRDGLHYNEATA
jgi:hypothetical protein